MRMIKAEHGRNDQRSTRSINCGTPVKEVLVNDNWIPNEEYLGGKHE